MPRKYISKLCFLLVYVRGIFCCILRKCGSTGSGGQENGEFSPTQKKIQNNILISITFQFCTGEVVNEKFWKNHGSWLHTLAVLYTNSSSIRSLQLKKWISWLLAHYFHFYIFPFPLLEKQRMKKSRKVTEYCYTYTHYIIYKFQLNLFTITEVINFLWNF